MNLLPPEGTQERLAFEHRFWAKVRKDTTSSCWEWRGSLKGSGQGYGAFSYRGRMVRAHRVALALRLGRDLLTKEHALHSCDNTRCCNPAHLYPGDHAQNMRDTATRQRRIGLKGASNPQAKLKEADVLTIRAADRTLTQLATQFGVDPSLISLIRLRKIWKHVA